MRLRDRDAAVRPGEDEREEASERRAEHDRSGQEPDRPLDATRHERRAGGVLEVDRALDLGLAEDVGDDEGEHPGERADDQAAHEQLADHQ